MQKLDLLRLLRLLRHVLKLDGVQSLRWANGDTVQLFGVRFSLTYLRRKRFKDPRLLFRYAEGVTKETILEESSNDFSGLGAILCLLTEELSMSTLHIFAPRGLEIPTLILAWKSDAQHPLESAQILHAPTSEGSSVIQNLHNLHNGRIEDLLPRAQLCVAESWAEIEEFPARISHFLNNLL